MSENYIRNVVEAALLAAGRPLQLNELAQLFEEHSRPEPDALRAALAVLDADYGNRGIEVKETANGFRIQVRKEMANEVSRLWPERPPKYSRALLETMALIAYRQPITRAEIEAVRGVAVNPNIIKTVIERNWVRVVGTRDVPGRPELLGTTKDFLDYFGLRALDELPPLAELKAMGEINLQLDLAKPGDSGSDDGSSGSGSSGADGAGGEGGGASGAPSDSSVAAAGAAAAVAVAVASDADADADADTDVDADGDADGEGAVESVAIDSVDAVADVGEGTSVGDATPPADDITFAAIEAGPEVATADAAATSDDAVAEPVAAASSEEPLVAFEHDPHAATITHVDIESDAGDVTVEVEALRFVEQQLEAQEQAVDAAIETGEFEMSELGIAQPTPVIEAEFEVEDIGVTHAEEDEAADDEEELSASPQSSTELVAAPRDRDD